MRSEGTVLGRNVVVESGAVVEAAEVGEGTVIEVGAVIGRGSIIGKVDSLNSSLHYHELRYDSTVPLQLPLFYRQILVCQIIPSSSVALSNASIVHCNSARRFCVRK